MALTNVEDAALRGMESLTREMYARHAADVHQQGMEMLEVMADIAVAHGLPVDAFFDGWGIAGDRIVRLDGVTPAEVEG